MGKKSESFELEETAEAQTEEQIRQEQEQEQEFDLLDRLDQDEGRGQASEDWNGGLIADANSGGGNGMSNVVLDEVEFDEEEELEEEVVPDDFIPLWKPSEPGESLVGIVTSKFESVYGPALSVKTRSGALYQTPAHQSLIKRIEKIQPGDTIRILYEGKVRTSKGFIAASYRVFRADRKQKKIEGAGTQAEAEAEALSQAEASGGNAREREMSE